MSALNSVFFVDYHIIAKIIKAKLVIGTVGYISVVCLLLLSIRHSVNNKSDRKSHETIELTHPLGVTLCKIIINGYDMNAFSRKRVKICRKGRNEGLTFTRFHFTDTSLMKHDTTDYLNGEMAHTEYAVACLSASGKGFGKNIVKRLSVFKSIFKLPRLSFKVFIRQSSVLFLKFKDLFLKRKDSFNLFFAVISEKFLN